MQEEEVEKEKITELRVTEHIYVPKHEIISEEEAQELLKRIHARPEQLPYRRVSDPVVRELGAKPGQILKITRRSETAGESVYYRYVVE